MYVSSFLLSSDNVRPKAFLKGFSMRLELTLVSSINDPWLVRLVFIGVVVLLSWSVFKIYPYSFFGPTTTIFMYIYICVCVCVCFMSI